MTHEHRWVRAFVIVGILAALSVASHVGLLPHGGIPARVVISK